MLFRGSCSGSILLVFVGAGVGAGLIREDSVVLVPHGVLSHHATQRHTSHGSPGNWVERSWEWTLSSADESSSQVRSCSSLAISLAAAAAAVVAAAAAVATAAADVSAAAAEAAAVVAVWLGASVRFERSSFITPVCFEWSSSSNLCRRTACACSPSIASLCHSSKFTLLSWSTPRMRAM